MEEQKWVCNVCFQSCSKKSNICTITIETMDIPFFLLQNIPCPFYKNRIPDFKEQK